MFEEQHTQVGELTRFVGSVRPDRLAGEAAVALLELAARIERVGAGLKLLVAERAAVASDWRDEGHASAASWLASVTSSSVGEAVSVLETARRLPVLEATSAALGRGELSLSQAKAVAAGAAADHAWERELIEAAGHLSVKSLQHRARMLEAVAAEGNPETHEIQRRRRHLRIWSEPEGFVRLAGGLDPDAGAALFSAVRSRAAHLADDAYRATKQTEPQAAYDADALVSLCRREERRDTFSGPVGDRAQSTDVILHVDLAALRRGRLCSGERCEIPGLGPVPLSVAEHLMGEATTRLVVSDGVEVATVCHLGRTVPAHLRTALEARDPVCVVPECANTVNLEIDHWQVPYGQGGPTALWNLARICAHHHRQKTYEGFTLRGGPGKWEWVART